MSQKHEPKTFMVKGLSVTQGSITPFPYMKGDGSLGVAVPQSKKVTDWRKVVAKVAKQVYPTVEYGQYEQVSLDILFCFERPKSNKRKFFTVKKADLDKLQRTILDSLSGIVYEDDCQVTEIHASKVYADMNCVFIRVRDHTTPYSDLLRDIVRWNEVAIQFTGGEAC